MIVDGYIRISQVNGREGESFISPTVQREQIEEWACSRSAAVATVFEEFEESGARDDRPLLMKALERVESGLTDGLVVATLDRFGRSLLGGLAAIERIQRAGGTFASVGDGFDLSTDTGKLVARIMLAIGEWELDRIRGHWETARERATGRGVHTGRFAPAGYAHGEGRRLSVDPLLGPLVVEVFRRRADGATLAQLAAFLNESGAPALATRWQPSMLRRVLANRTYLGELRNGGAVNSDSHRALVSEELWSAAQRAPSSPGATKPRLPAPLSGILRCAGCRMAMSARTVRRSDGREDRVYACNGESAAGACGSRATVSGSVAEPLLDGVHFTVLRDGERCAAQAATLRALEQELLVARGETERYRDAPHSGSTKRFIEGVAQRSAREQRLRLALEAERARLGLPDGPSAEEWEARWPTMSVQERRKAMQASLIAVFVQRGRGLPEQRMFICASPQDSERLPRRGKIATRIIPIELGSLVLRPYAIRDQAPCWPERRIRGELRRFLGDRKRWPDAQQFIQAGQGPLLRQIERSGDAPRWARELGMSVRGLAARPHYWTDARVRAALSFLLERRSHLPGTRELAALGYAGLARAIERRGRTTWAAEFGVACETRPGRRGPKDTKQRRGTPASGPARSLL
jgi:DNA invertase Pin-like site-specific DNA recombinase